MNNPSRKGSEKKELNSAGSENWDKCWYVAGTCALVTIMTSATIRSSGFLYVGIMEEFQVDRGQASWPICLMGAVNNLAGNPAKRNLSYSK